MSDKAPVMFSNKKKSVYFSLSRWIDHPILRFHCNCHQLVLTIILNIRNAPLMKEIDELAESLRKFFHTHRNKPLKFLDNIAKVFNENYVIFR